jgi:hypothetical protein
MPFNAFHVTHTLIDLIVIIASEILHAKCSENQIDNDVDCGQNYTEYVS